MYKSIRNRNVGYLEALDTERRLSEQIIRSKNVYDEYLELLLKEHKYSEEEIARIEENLYDRITVEIDKRVNQRNPQTVAQAYNCVTNSKHTNATATNELIDHDMSCTEIKTDNVRRLSLNAYANPLRYNISPAIKLSHNRKTYWARLQDDLTFPNEKRCTCDRDRMLDPGAHVKRLSYVRFIPDNGKVKIFTRITNDNQYDGIENHNDKEAMEIREALIEAYELLYRTETPHELHPGRCVDAVRMLGPEKPTGINVQKMIQEILN